LESNRLQQRRPAQRVRSGKPSAIARKLLLAAALLPAPALQLIAQDVKLEPLDRAAAERLASKTLSGFEGTPLPVVERMLELAQVRPNELVYDLGSGDGRILIMAAQKFEARAVGVELDPRLCRLSLRKIDALGLGNQVQVIEGDMTEQDWSRADVVLMYQTPYALNALKPHLERYSHHGMRIVSCVNEVPGWKPTTMLVVSGGNSRDYKLNLYVISRPGEWVSFSKFGRAP
jgi:SAM-dependent methyltransferase